MRTTGAEQRGAFGFDADCTTTAIRRRLSLLALIAATLVACGSPEPAALATQDVAALTDALAQSVMVSYQATRGEAEPDDATRVVGEARTIILDLGEVAAALEPAGQSAAFELTELANEILVQIGQTEYERAEKLRLEVFNPAAAGFGAVLSDPSAEVDPGSSWSPRKAIIALGVIALGGVLMAARYWSGTRPDPVVEAERRRAERSGTQTKPIERTWSEIPTTFGQVQTTPSDARGWAGTTSNVRSIEIPLNRLLTTALFQVKDQGWDMSIVCPEVSVMADPVRLRHAIMAILSKFFHDGARQVGIVVEDLRGDVLLTIGRDAPPGQEEAERLTEHFVEQIAWALDVDEVESSLINDEDVTLISVSLGRKVGASDVSEPVA